MDQFRIGELAARTGVSIDTIRYYEQRSLLPRASRLPGGFRVFAPEAVERIRFIRQAQEIGLSLDEIRELLTNGGGAEKCRRVSDLLRAKLDKIGSRIKTMQNFRRTLARHLTRCERELNDKGNAAECPVMVEIGHGNPRSARLRKERKK
jgi:DNA-binding transcriptional MerR regulator